MKVIIYVPILGESLNLIYEIDSGRSKSTTGVRFFGESMMTPKCIKCIIKVETFDFLMKHV